MFNVVIFGAPGSGKGTQSERIISEYGLFHISTGDVLREQIAKGTELGKIADSYISKGQLIPDELMIDILSQVLDANPQAGKGVIFDGFPRTIEQAKALKKMLALREAEVDVVVGLEVEEEELIERITETRTGIGPLRRQSGHDKKTSACISQPDETSQRLLCKRGKI